MKTVIDQIRPGQTVRTRKGVWEKAPGVLIGGGELGRKDRRGAVVTGQLDLIGTRQVETFGGLVWPQVSQSVMTTWCCHVTSQSGCKHSVRAPSLRLPTSLFMSVSVGVFLSHRVCTVCWSFRTNNISCLFHWNLAANQSRAVSLKAEAGNSLNVDI